MRVFLSGLIGAAVSAAAWFGTEYVSHKELGFLAIAVGLVTGLCVNAAAGKAAPQSFSRAIFAVVLTLVAIVGGRYVYAGAMQKLNEVSTIAAAKKAPVEGEEAAAEEGEGAVGEVAETEIRELPIEAGGKVKFNKPSATAGSALDLAWMGIAALVAYVTGKGAGHPVGAVVAEAVAESKSEEPNA